jgi:cell division protease FtsH
VLDPALLRPGRFDRRVAVQRPDRAGREQILRVHTRGVPLAPDVALGEVAAATPGLVGAELRNLVNEAALLAARRGRDAVGRDEFLEALEKTVLGAARHVMLAPAERRRVAYHEAGHALVGLSLPGADPVRKVSIVPRGQALGATYQVPADDRHNDSRAYLLARITGLLAGRAAEEVVFGQATTGAEDDLALATALARRMATRWGISEEVGMLALDDAPREDGGGPRWYSEATARTADRAVRALLERCHRAALALLARDRLGLDALAAALLERETLEEDDLRRFRAAAALPAAAA